MTNALAPLPTTDLSDAHPDKVHMVQLPFRDYGRTRAFAGRVHTCVCVEDTKLVQDTLFSMPGDGGVIVIDAGGSMRTAMLGDRMADRLIGNGWAGIVVNGAVRDAAGLADMDLGIKALGTTPLRSAKFGSGAIDVPLAFGGVLFQRGFCIYCDEDGVLVSDDPLTL